MSKKKKKSQSNASSSKNSNNKSTTTTQKLVVNNQNNSDNNIFFPSSECTQYYFLLLSLCGVFNASDYNVILDEVITNSQHNNNTINRNNIEEDGYHSEDQIDHVMNAMDLFDNERQLFASSISKLASSLQSFIIFQKKKRRKGGNGDNNNSDDDDDDDENENDFKWINEIEQASIDLQSQLIAYKEQCIAKQRSEIIKCQQYLTTASPTQYQHHYLLKVDLLHREDYYTKLGLLNEYRSMFQSLIQELKHQLQWEEIVIAKLKHLLLHENIYSFYNTDDDKEYDYFYHHNQIQEEKLQQQQQHQHQSSINICHDLKKWSNVIQHCTLLNVHKWRQVTKSLMKDIIQYSKKPVLSDEINNDDKLYHAKAKMNELDLTDFIEAIKVKNDEDNVDCDNDEHESYLQNKKKDILTSTCIEQAINYFLDQHILNVIVRERENCDSTKEEDVWIKRQMNKPNQIFARMLSSNSVGDSYDLYKYPLFLLLVGPSNTGKTYFCNNLQNVITSMNNRQIQVIYPRVPSDFIGPTVGSCEDALQSLFTFALNVIEGGKQCIILLDGMEKLLLDNNTNHNDRSSVTTRMRCMLIQIIDRLKLDKHSVLENLLVIGTVQSRDDDLLGRFDKYFELGDPDWEERYQIIKLSFALKEVYLDEDASKMLSSAVTSLMGKSRGEIALCCRDAMNNATANDDIDDLTSSRIRLESLHISLQNVTPESLKQLSSDESIEMRVYSSTELQSYLDFDDNGKVVFPLYGENANMAWRQLQNTIIVPLCRWQELDQLMYGDEGQDNLIMQKSITCGALLTGAPGSGKTAIVYHCAAIAARIEPTIRLLDVSCTSLISKEVGGSEKNIGRLFKTAQSAAPCIILLDGIENIAPLRGNDNTTEGTMDRLLSTLLIEMDGVKNDSTGVDDSNKRIAVIGVTHNPVSLIDPAMLRPGRLDKCIHMGYPDESARVEIIERELNDLSIEFSNTRHGVPKDVTELCEYLASKTESAADLISLSKNARISAVRDAIEGNELTIRVDHFLAVANN